MSTLMRSKKERYILLAALAVLVTLLVLALVSFALGLPIGHVADMLKAIPMMLKAAPAM